ncbi:tRNA(Ile)-lysidine synthase [Carnobacterium sp. 17-4]|uniref:tRNA lysidine(34) synthetase TilS n=1 Tax=Carnobacterium sp. (strain 17-4) TaxID=208596 RepID=UPI0002058BB7|nr:tRNA lysidine(34) synthetase TilS [Carnobacterium sp. 17-4]AEB28947.1 tRNA(Ile)-lysidine synthase [Carnobacterium sp. 17-4]
MNIHFDFLEHCQNDLYWKSTDRLLLAVSGGVDSMVLVDLIQRLPNAIRPWFGVVHVNHQLRQASMEEEKFLSQYCASNRIPFFFKRWPVEEHQVEGVEAAAREFRYAFFHEVLKEQQATHLLTGHHGDDQMETILMRLVRGGQLESIAGIKKHRTFYGKQLTRPLLDYSKETLYQYSQERSLSFYEDESNNSLEYTRNRYRHQIIPLLKKENTQVLTHFADFSSDLQDVITVAKQEIEKQAANVCFQKGPFCWELDVPLFLTFEPAMKRQVMQILFNKIFHKEVSKVGRKHQVQIIDLIEKDKPNSQLNLPGNWIGQKTYHKFYFFKENEQEVTAKKLQSIYSLNLGKWLPLPNGARIGLFEATKESVFTDQTKKVIWLNPESIQLPLQVRNRKPGDRITLKGLETGSKKIKDLFIDQKIPRNKREEAILVTDNKEEIIWLVEYKESRLSIEPETDKIHYILIYESK